MTTAVLQFLLLGAVILAAGSKLSRYGDIIAEKSGLGRTWIGMILMASITSIPELATGVSSTVVVMSPDLAVGDVLGSCMFNLVIIALMDFAGGRQPISTRAHPGQVVAAGFTILLLALVSLSLLGGGVFPRLGWFGLSAPVLIVVYFLAMRTVYSYEKRRIHESAAVDVVPEYGSMSLRTALIRYLMIGLVIIAAASFLPMVGARIAEHSGLGETFVGNLLMAFSTSLPELVVSIAAVRLGAIDLAYGNILGSNLFNILILAIDDLLFLPGPILQSASPSQGVAGLIAICMTAVLIVALTVRSERRFFLLAWESVAILLLYLAGAGLLFAMRIPAGTLG